MSQKKHSSADCIPTAENQRQRKKILKEARRSVCAGECGGKSVLTYRITKDDKYNQLIRNHVSKRKVEELKC